MRNKAIDNSAQNNLVIHNYGNEVKTGNLTIKGLSVCENSTQLIIDQIYNAGDFPQESKGTQWFQFLSKDWENIGQISIEKYNDERIAIKLQVFNPAKNSSNGAIRLFLKANGVDYFTATPGIMSSIVNWGAPNYGAGVAVSSGYTAPTDGVITVSAGGNNRTSNVSINGVNIFNSDWGASYGSPDNAEYRVGAGQIITLSGVSCKFYPLLGA